MFDLNKTSIRIYHFITLFSVVKENREYKMKCYIVQNFAIEKMRLNKSRRKLQLRLILYL